MTLLDRIRDVTSGPMIMAIINATPDSFYGPSRLHKGENSRAFIEDALSAGVKLFDVGGESSRPGAEYVSESQELERVMPMVELLVGEYGAWVSVDTRKSGVARHAIASGAAMINDISGLEDDEQLGVLCAETGVPLCIMHKRGTPKTMQQDISYPHGVVAELKTYFDTRIAFAQSLGIKNEQLILDPGIGFGKRLEDNLAILRAGTQVCSHDLPLLIGHSRKSFIGKLLSDDDGRERPTEGRLFGSLAVATWAASRGARIIRTHDPVATADVVTIAHALVREAE